ncbi:Lysophospholipase L1 [bacterium A37T11]|nr:Lysophospholipase L1 [bacterium A37T11]
MAAVYKRVLTAGLLVVLGVVFNSFNQKEKVWLALGDSITYLNDHLDETGNRVTKGYLTRVTEDLPGLKYINQGHNGWTAINIAKKLDDLGLSKADIYTVFLGTNDWWAGNPLGTLTDYQQNTGNNTVYGAFRTIIDRLRSLNKTAKIVLITPMQRADFVYVLDAKNNAWGSYKEKKGQSLEQFAEVVKAIGRQEGLAVIDLYHQKSLSVKHLVKFKRLKDPQSAQYKNFTYPAYTSVPFDPQADEYPYPPESIGMTYDGLHPSDQGNAVIAKLVSKAIR